MKIEDNPDYVVYNKETGKYDAFLKTYQTSISGPKIEIQDLSSFKQSSISKAHHKFDERFQEIQNEVKSLLEEYRDNDLVWGSEMSFEPHIGTEIYLYQRKNSSFFCSLISPEEWGNKFPLVGKFKLDSSHIWKKIH
jgi:hypothetical protein